MKTIKQQYAYGDAGFERFAKSGRRRRPSLGHIKDRVSQDIVEATRTRGHGSIFARDIDEAIGQLAKWLTRHSKRLIEVTFRNLVSNRIYRFNEHETRYVLVAV